MSRVDYADVLFKPGRGQTRARQPAMRGAWKFTDEDLASSPIQRMSPEAAKACARSMPKNCLPVRRSEQSCGLLSLRVEAENALLFQLDIEGKCFHVT